MSNSYSANSYGSTDTNLHGENILTSTDDEESLVAPTMAENGDADTANGGDSQTLLSIVEDTDTDLDSDTFFGEESTRRISNMTPTDNNHAMNIDTSNSSSEHSPLLSNGKGYTNGHGNGHINGHGNGHTNGHVNGHGIPNSSSSTSSLGFSDFERSEGGEDTNGIQIVHPRYGKHTSNGNGQNHEQARVAMNKPTFDALKDGGKRLTKDENRSLTTILVGVIFICVISIIFLRDLMMSSNSSGGGEMNGGTTNSGGSGLNPSIPYFPTPDGKQFASKGGLHSAKKTSAYVPFPTIDRENGDGMVSPSDIVFTELFHSSLRLDDTNITSDNSSADAEVTEPLPKDPVPLLRVPVPSGAFWSNFVIRPTSDRGLSYPIMAYPYGFKWNPSILQASYPPLRRMTDDISIRDIFNPDVTFSIEEEVTKRNIVRYDPLSVTVRFYENQVNPETELQGNMEPDPETTYWESYLVQGSPYITIKYQGVTPILQPLSIFQSFTCPRDANGNYKDDASESFASDASDPNHFGICSKENSKHPRDVTLKGVQFLIQTQENLTWMLFASKPITLTYDGLRRRTIKADDKFDGVLRFALLPPPLHADNEITPFTGATYEKFPMSDSSGVKRLIYHAHTYPIGAKLSWDFRDLPTSPSFRIMNNANKNVKKDIPEGVTVGTVNFEYETKSMRDEPDNNNLRSTGLSNDATELLMLGLPHHAQVMPPNDILKDFDLGYQTIKGVMAPIVGDKWSYDEPLTNIEFDDASSMEKIASLSPDAKKLMLDQVEKDLGRVLPVLGESVYGYGKQVARLAQLAYIASVLEQPQPIYHQKKARSDETTSSTNLTERATVLLHKYLTAFLDGSNQDNLIYDINFGGITTKNGVHDQDADFGSGWYNDHHFHYGYTLYASAILGKLNATFVSEYGAHVDSILFDVAHESNLNSDISESAFFPFTRHKSWFDGHSFASGLFPFGNGKSQESSSEAVNCYYGAYLWNSVRWNNVMGGEDRINFAKLLLAMEVRGAKTYWHMLDPSLSSKMDSIHSASIYKPSFEKSLMVGNLGMMDVTITTWFGNEKLYVHMINVIPVTAITKELFDPSYVEEEYNTIIKPMYDQVEMAWRGYCVADRGLIEPNEAWEDATKLISYELDTALSLSQLYYWISSIEGFDQSRIIGNHSDDADTPDGSPNQDGGEPSETPDASCEAHQRCVDLGLGGFCCPSPDGTFLDCC